MIAPKDKFALESWQRERHDYLVSEHRIREQMTTPPVGTIPFCKVNYLYDDMAHYTQARGGHPSPPIADTPVTRLPRAPSAQELRANPTLPWSSSAATLRPGTVFAPPVNQSVNQAPARRVMTPLSVHEQVPMEPASTVFFAEPRPPTPNSHIRSLLQPNETSDNVSERSGRTASSIARTTSQRALSERSGTARDSRSQSETSERRAAKSAALLKSREEVLEELERIDAEIARGGSTASINSVKSLGGISQTSMFNRARNRLVRIDERPPPSRG